MLKSYHHHGPIGARIWASLFVGIQVEVAGHVFILSSPGEWASGCVCVAVCVWTACGCVCVTVCVWLCVCVCVCVCVLRMCFLCVWEPHM